MNAKKELEDLIKEADGEPFIYLNDEYAYRCMEFVRTYAPELLERIRKLEEALRFYADHSWPTWKIPLGNGQTVTGMGLGYPDGSVARQALEDKT